MKRAALGLLLALWGLGLIAANPRGNFPIDDDWCFAPAVHTLVDQHDLRFPFCAQQTLVTHLLWGGAFVAASHFSFTVLRTSTIVLAGAGIIATWLLLLEVGASATTAWFAAALFAFNPIVFSLTTTFMTDVPFAAWSTIAAWCFVRAIKRPTASAILIASVFAMLSTLLRQPGILLPLMFAPACVVAHGRSRANLVNAVAPFAIVFAAFWGFEHWVALTGRTAAQYGSFLGGLNDAGAISLRALVWRVVARGINVAFHASWYAWPIVIWTVRRPATRRGRVWLLGSVAAVAALVFASGKTAPWGSSLLYDFGVGAVMLHGADLPGMPLPHAPHALWRAFTVIVAAGATAGLAGLAAFGWRSIRSWADTNRIDAALVLFATGVVLMFWASVSLLQFYDRYLLFLIPLFAVIAVLASPALGAGRWSGTRAIAAAALAGYAAFAVLTSHDYFEWDRARWRAVDLVMATGRYASEDVDGGLEFTRSLKTPTDYLAHPKVIVTVGPLDGYRICQRVPFRRWLPPRTDTIVVLVPVVDPCPLG